jgi:hypothetical protein
MDDEDLRAAYSRMRTDGSIGGEVAQYLKDMSGTAASEAEALRTLRTMIGAGTFGSATVKKEVLEQFIEDKSSRLKDEAKSLYRQGYEYTAGSYLYGKKKRKKKKSLDSFVIGGK